MSDAANFVKSPNDVLDYRVDWSAWLGADTIDTSTWTVETGITKDSQTNTTTTATVWLSGGTAGIWYRCTNQIVTAGGRTAQRSINVKVEEQ